MTKLNPNPEVWRNLGGEFRNYSISSLGRLMRNSPELLVKPHVNRGGYMRANIRRSSDGQQVRMLMHRLVAMAFLEKQHSEAEINHINGIKTDNRPENIEWVTRTENQRHAARIGLRESSGFAAKRKLSDREAIVIRTLIGRGVTQAFLARWFDLGRSTMWHLLRGDTYQASAAEVFA